jgi:hypothetical protein
MSKDITFPKTSAEVAARAIVDGIARGDEDILPDPMARNAFETWSRDPKALERQPIAPADLATHRCISLSAVTPGDAWSSARAARGSVQSRYAFAAHKHLPSLLGRLLLHRALTLGRVDVLRFR